MQPSEQRTTPMSVQDFTLLGMHEVAYVKPVDVDGITVFTVHAADGTQIASIQNARDVAFAAVRQHELEPVSVH
jgi:hypothetical protein